MIDNFNTVHDQMDSIIDDINESRYTTNDENDSDVIDESGDDNDSDELYVDEDENKSETSDVSNTDITIIDDIETNSRPVRQNAGAGVERFEPFFDRKT